MLRFVRFVILKIIFEQANICPDCGATLAEGAKFCMNCGKKLVSICPNCKHELENGAKFCMECGYKL